jgi:Flp pilus assembly pilin Flp
MLCRHIVAFATDRSGATSIEYAMIAFFVSIVIVAGATEMGTKVMGYFSSLVASV